MSSLTRSRRVPSENSSFVLLALYETCTIMTSLCSVPHKTFKASKPKTPNKNATEKICEALTC